MEIKPLNQRATSEIYKIQVSFEIFQQLDIVVDIHIIYVKFIHTKGEVDI